jgi:hypothetical protein
MSPSCHTPLIESVREECDAQELAFVREYVPTGSPVKSVQKAGYRLNKKIIAPAAARMRANVLLDRPRVQAALKEIQATLAAATHVTMLTLTRELDEARYLALDRGQAAAAITATMAKAKLHGLDVSQSTVEHRMSIDFSGAAGELFAALAGRAAIGAPVVTVPAVSSGKDEREPARIAPGRARDVGVRGEKVGEEKEVACSPLARKRNLHSLS